MSRLSDDLHNYLTVIFHGGLRSHSLFNMRVAAEIRQTSMGGHLVVTIPAKPGDLCEVHFSTLPVQPYVPGQRLS